MSFNPKVVKFPNKVTGKLRIGNTAADYGVYGTGTVQKFELGTRYRVDDRVFRYGRAGSALNPMQGAFDYGTFFARNSVVAAVAGQMYIVITTDATSGSVTNGFGVKDNMVGGYMSQPGANKTVRRITGHVAAPTGTTVKVYLDGPCHIALVTNSFLEWCPNPYRDLRTAGAIAGGINKAVMGVPSVAIASGSFGWFQTWGPTWCAPNAGGDFGAADEQVAHFHDGGNIEDAANNAAAQVAGFIMGARTFGNWTNPPFIFLTISP